MGRPRFVIHKHDASRLHYDLRLEKDGVLKSWAVPKGPSIDPREKRLAVPTENHPLEYATFEGVIPEGQYGAGSVLVWDAGTYRSLKEVPLGQAVQEGHITFWLEGSKLRGGFALTRTRTGKNEWWLLVKMNDEYADAAIDLLATKPESALTGHTIEELKESSD